jgi:hypothetical protein
MPRSKGHDKHAAIKLQRIETIQFNLRAEPETLRLAKLRIAQAIRRDESLKDLLQPAADEIDQVLAWNKESVQALNEIKNGE